MIRASIGYWAVKIVCGCLIRAWTAKADDPPQPSKANTAGADNNEKVDTQDAKPDTSLKMPTAPKDE